MALVLSGTTYFIFFLFFFSPLLYHPSHSSRHRLRDLSQSVRDVYQICITQNHLVSELLPSFSLPILSPHSRLFPHTSSTTPCHVPFSPPCPPSPASHKTPLPTTVLVPLGETPRQSPCQWIIPTRPSKKPEYSPIEKTVDDSLLDDVSKPKFTPWLVVTPVLLEVVESQLCFIPNLKCLSKRPLMSLYQVFLRGISRFNRPFRGLGTVEISIRGKLGGIIPMTSPT
jgi:hypothetical protein